MVNPIVNNNNNVPEGESRTSFDVSVAGLPDSYYFESSVVEVTLIESLLSPSTHSILVMQDSIYYTPDGQIKNLNIYKGKKFIGNFIKQDLQASMDVEQTVYRISNRKPVNYNVEQYEIHSIDNYALKNVTKRMSKYFKCTSPTKVVANAFICAGVDNYYLQPAGPVRDYNAQNIHPYQVIAQQADAALDGNDPSFLHYMTLENTTGKQYFRSIKNIAASGSIFTYVWTEKGGLEGYNNPRAIISYEFPCDFDLLSDLLNGLDQNGEPTNTSLITHDIWNGQITLTGANDPNCGVGAGLTKTALTNANSAKEGGSCNVDVESYMPLRQARLGLLEQDKITLRIKVPFNPNLHAGNIITTNFYNKTLAGKLEYGSGDYMICSMSHNIKTGGYGVTTLDLVSSTIEAGIL